MMNVLKRHDWPGNVRELQNVIERAVVFSTDSLLRLPLMDLKQMTRQPSAWNSGALAEAEREHIMYALKHTDGGRRTAWRRCTAWIAADNFDLQNAKTWNRDAPLASDAASPARTSARAHPIWTARGRARFETSGGLLKGPIYLAGSWRRRNSICSGLRVSPTA